MIQWPQTKSDTKLYKLFASCTAVVLFGDVSESIDC